MKTLLNNMLVWLANRASQPPTCFRVSHVRPYPPFQNTEDNFAGKALGHRRVRTLWGPSVETRPVRRRPHLPC